MTDRQQSSVQWPWRRTKIWCSLKSFSHLVSVRSVWLSSSTKEFTSALDAFQPFRLALSTSESTSVGLTTLWSDRGQVWRTGPPDNKSDGKLSHDWQHQRRRIEGKQKKQVNLVQIISPFIVSINCFLTSFTNAHTSFNQHLKTEEQSTSINAYSTRISYQGRLICVCVCVWQNSYQISG